MLPFILRRPASGPVLVYDSPHSGRFYPDDFDTKATTAELRLVEDAYVDDLLGGTVVHGVAVLDATWPRACVDVDCAEDDLDVSLLADEWPAPVKPTKKTLQGFGLVRRLARPGVAIYDRQLTAAEVVRRLEKVHRPYHTALARLLEEVRAAHGFVWFVDWHSMRSADAAAPTGGEPRRRPDFIVANLDGASAGAELTDRTVDTLRGMGYDVALNVPHHGGEILRRHGRPAAGAHGVQVVINRALYLDEEIVMPNEGMAALRRDIDYFTSVLAEAARTRGGA
jgi:N-formylglutamate deformylase